MMKCIIVDDEPLAIEIIETYLNQVKGITLVAHFTDSVEAFTFLQQNKIDLLFLDLNMPLLDGMELLKSLKHKPSVIITTAYRDFAVESFELDVVDYLVKPIAFPRFLKAVNKVITPLPAPVKESILPESKADGKNQLWLKVDKKLIPVAPQDILYIQSLKDYVRVVTHTERLITYYTLNAILEKLPSPEFIQIHKSYIVQVAKIEAIEGNMVTIKKEALPIGRIYRKSLLKLIE